VDLLLEKLVGVAGFEPAPPPRPERGSGPAEFATILLPNCSVRSRIGQHQGAGRREIMADLLDTLLLGGMQCYRPCRTPKPGGGHTMPAHRGKFVAYYRVTTHKQGKSGPGMRNLP
jgi:hypothetical protein